MGKIEDYKFWKQDDKERNKRRKIMIQKLWKGRKKPKIIPLDCAGEQKLVDIIADKEPSDDEEEEEEFPSSSSKKPRISSGEILPPKRCIWEATDPKGCVDSTKASTSSSDIDFGSGCVWANEDLEDNPEDSNSEDKASDTRESTSSFQVPTQSMLEVPFESHGDRKNSQEVFADALDELHGLIPESELAELLQTDDLLFCEAKPKVAVLGSIENVMKNKENTKDSRKSLRRSARINSVPNMTEFGSIYTGSERSGDEEAFGGKNVLGETTNAKNIPKKKKLKRCAPKVGASVDKENAPQVSQKVVEEEKVAMQSSSKKKKRRSYSRETGSGRFSLDGSRKNSLLTLTGDMEINISMPGSVRRSFSGVATPSFSSSSRVSPTPHSLSATLKEEELSVRKITEVISLPVPGFISSEDEEEEVMISGNIRSKYFKNKVKLTK